MLLPLPYFLLYFLLYVLVFLYGLVLCRRAVENADRTDTYAPLPLPEKLDLYEVAYLRTEDRIEVARLAVLALVNSGYLTVWHGGEHTILERRREGQDLPQPLSTVLNWFSTPQEVEKMFNDDPRLGDLSPLCLEFEKRLKKESLLALEEAKSAGATAGGVSLTLLVVLSVPIFFELSDLGWWPGSFLLLIVVFILASACDPGRLSKRGEDYLARLKIKARGVPAGGLFQTSVGNDAHSHLLVAFALSGFEGVREPGYTFLSTIWRPNPVEGAC